MQRVGLIAGNGRFPLIFARTARAEGVAVVAVAHEGETLPELAGVVDHVTWIKVGEFGRMIETFQDAGIDRAVMAGGIRKAALFEHFAPDDRGMQFLARLGSLGDDTLLRGLAGELESEGIRIVESTLFLSSLLSPRARSPQQVPDEAQWTDIRHGFAVAKAIGRWDIGQSVVVKSGIVLAVEAIEGTDATIQRGGRGRRRGGQGEQAAAGPALRCARGRPGNGARLHGGRRRRARARGGQDVAARQGRVAAASRRRRPPHRRCRGRRAEAAPQ